MIRKLALLIFVQLSGILFLSLALLAQRGQFTQNLKLGLGGGVNFAVTNVSSDIVIYEDLAGNEITTEYSPVFKNFGHQYFFLAEYSLSPLVIGLRPGTYSYNFSSENTLVFEDSEVTESHDYTLRYFEIPLDVKYLFTDRKLQPFLGGTIAWGTLLGKGSTTGNGFIHNRFTLGLNAGAYYDTGFITFVLTSGYNYGLHVITSKSNRFETAAGSPYSIGDIKLNHLFANLSLLFSLEKKRFASFSKCVYPYR